MPWLSGRGGGGQTWNGAGAGQALRFLTQAGERALAVPHVRVADLRALDWAGLKASGFKGCVFDKDNTLTLPYENVVHPAVRAALEDCKRAFPGKLLIVSNSSGLEAFDPDGAEAAAVERALGIPVLRHRAKKPEGEPGPLEAHFGCGTEELVMVGDRVFTDVVFGNKMGMLTVKVEPFPESAGEKVTVRFSKWAEDRLLRRWADRVDPPPHRLSQTGGPPWRAQEKFTLKPAPQPAG